MPPTPCVHPQNPVVTGAITVVKGGIYIGILFAGVSVPLLGPKPTTLLLNKCRICGAV